MFEHEEFFSAEREVIDMHVFTNKIYHFILEETAKLTPYAELLSQMTSSELFLFY